MPPQDASAEAWRLLVLAWSPPPNVGWPWTLRRQPQTAWGALAVGHSMQSRGRTRSAWGIFVAFTHGTSRLQTMVSVLDEKLQQ